MSKYDRLWFLKNTKVKHHEKEEMWTFFRLEKFNLNANSIQFNVKNFHSMDYLAMLTQVFYLTNRLMSILSQFIKIDKYKLSLSSDTGLILVRSTCLRAIVHELPFFLPVFFFLINQKRKISKGMFSHRCIHCERSSTIP